MLQLRVLGSLDTGVRVTDASTLDSHDVHSCGMHNHTAPIYYTVAAA